MDTCGLGDADECSIAVHRDRDDTDDEANSWWLLAESHSPTGESTLRPLRALDARVRSLFGFAAAWVCPPGESRYWPVERSAVLFFDLFLADSICRSRRGGSFFFLLLVLETVSSTWFLARCTADRWIPWVTSTRTRRSTNLLPATDALRTALRATFALNVMLFLCCNADGRPMFTSQMMKTN